MVHLLDGKGSRPSLQIELGAALRPPGVRVQGERLLVFDEGGRVLVVSLRTGAVLREHRVS